MTKLFSSGSANATNTCSDKLHVKLNGIMDRRFTKLFNFGSTNAKNTFFRQIVCKLIWNS